MSRCGIHHSVLLCHVPVGATPRGLHYNKNSAKTPDTTRSLDTEITIGESNRTTGRTLPHKCSQGEKCTARSRPDVHRTTLISDDLLRTSISEANAALIPFEKTAHEPFGTNSINGDEVPSTQRIINKKALSKSSMETPSAIVNPFARRASPHGTIRPSGGNCMKTNFSDMQTQTLSNVASKKAKNKRPQCVNHLPSTANPKNPNVADLSNIKFACHRSVISRQQSTRYSEEKVDTARIEGKTTQRVCILRDQRFEDRIRTSNEIAGGESNVLPQYEELLPRKPTPRTHTDLTHAKRPHLGCRRCDECSSSKSKLMNDIQHKAWKTIYQHECNTSFTLKNCKGYSQISKSKTHDPRTNGKERLPLYPHCDKPFSQNSTSKRQVSAVHAKEMTYPCRQCDKRFSENSTLKRHVSSVHFEEKPYPCKLCETRFSRKSHLKVHVSAVHSEEKPYPCTQCEKRFSRKGDLNRHISGVHAEEKPYPCEQCEKRFSQKGNLKAHVSAVHDKVKSNQCTQCNKCFSENTALKMHVSSVHSEEMPYQCTQCGKRFSRKGILKAHVLTVHDKVKSYQCKQCEKRFSQKGNLKAHVSAVHEKKKPYPCTQCDKRFSRKFHLKQHVSAAHSSE